MPEPSVNVLGAYKLSVTPELFAEAMELKFGDVKLGAKQKREAEQAVREELSHVVLVEVLVAGRDKNFDVGDFSQEESDQAAYNEIFLSEDGSRDLGLEDPGDKTVRLAFFLHFFDPAKKLVTSYGTVPIPTVEEMPGRLSALVPYDPVD